MGLEKSWSESFWIFDKYYKGPYFIEIGQELKKCETPNFDIFAVFRDFDVLN